MSDRDAAIRDRAMAKSLASNAFIALSSSLSPSDAVKALASEVRALDPEAGRTDKNLPSAKANGAAQATAASSSSSFVDQAKQLAKLHKHRLRLVGHLSKLDEKIASCSTAQAEADPLSTPGDEALDTDLHVSQHTSPPRTPLSKTPIAPSSPPLHSVVRALDLSAAAPRENEAALSSGTRWIVDGVEVLTRPPSVNVHKAARTSAQGYNFRRLPPPAPDTPSPPKGMLKRDATSFVRSHLANHTHHSELEANGAMVEYMARMLIKCEEDGWGGIMETWGEDCVAKFVLTGSWRV